MKKLNNKGFTLIELLAVIVVLAIVMVISLTSVLGNTANATANAFKTSASTAAEWFEKQYGLCIANDEALDPSYKSAYSTKCDGDNVTINANLLKAAGLNATDYDATNSKVSIGTNGRACVKLVATSGGKFGKVPDATDADATPAKSSICP